MIEDRIMANPKAIPFFSIIGNTMKNTSEGNTAQNIPHDKSMTFCESPVSRKSQIIARMEVKGSDARMAPIKVKRLPNSDTPAMINAETRILIKNCVGNVFPLSSRR